MDKMKQSAIPEDNKLIAEFMKAVPDGDFYTGYMILLDGKPFHYGAGTNGIESLKFHSSWDWLMPVVEKIDNFDNAMSRQTVRAVKSNLFNIGMVYETVVEFIKWYNEQAK